MQLTQDLVKELFDYHEDGYLIWKKKLIKTAGRIKIGNRAGGLSNKKNDKRYKIGINCKDYCVSRVIFLWHNGYIPEFLDHKDRNSLNDKIENLRPATREENNRNVSSSKNSTSKYLGVSYDNRINKWTAEITINRKTKHLGRFLVESDAAIAYNKAATEFFKEFASINVIVIR